MSTDIVRQLVRENDQVAGELQRFQAAVAIIVMHHGKTKGAKKEYRIPKAALDKLNHQVTIRPLKTGGLVVTVKSIEDD